MLLSRGRRSAALEAWRRYGLYSRNRACETGEQRSRRSAPRSCIVAILLFLIYLYNQALPHSFRRLRA